MLDATLNVDYRTIDKEEFKRTILAGVHPQSLNGDLATNAQQYLNYLDVCKVAWHTEYKIMPETLWQAGRDMPTQCEFSVYVKWTPTSGETGHFKFFGAADALSTISIPQTLKVCKTYEAVLTYTASYDSSAGCYKLNFMNMAMQSQLDPAGNITNGIAPSQKNSSTDSLSFYYNWAPEGVAYTRYQTDIRKGN